MTTNRIGTLCVLTLLYTGLAVPANAQSLSGSRASIDRMYSHAAGNGIYFYKTGDGIRRAAAEGTFERLGGNANYVTHNVSYPYVRPATRTFVERLAAQYRGACGERLVVTSAARPQSMRLLNGADRSVHPAGIAVDLRRPSNSRCLSWLRTTLIQLERAGVIEATEERRPPHFHVAVFPAPYGRHVQGRGGDVRVATASAPAAVVADGAYRVRQGDSLWGIARRHQTTVDQLKAANGLSSAYIQIGQNLVIPER
jgi:hypothetical protein